MYRRIQAPGQADDRNLAVGIARLEHRFQPVFCVLSLRKAVFWLIYIVKSMT